MVVLSLLQHHPYTCCAGSIKQQHPNAPHRLGRCLRAQLVDSQQLAPSTASSSSSYDSEPVAGVLLDIDGVVCCGNKCGNQAIPGAADVIKHLKAAGVPYKFVTNTTTDKRAGVAARLAASGIPCSAEDILNPAVCAAMYIKEHNLGPVALFVAPALLPDFEGCPLLPDGVESGAAAVVIGDMGADWSYETLNRAFRLMMQQPTPQLLSLGKSRYYMAPDGLSLDVGPFTSALEYATGTSAVVLGKPASSVFHLAAQSLGLKPEQVVMVGDDVVGDVGGAQDAGCRGILVRTGKYRAGDEAGAVAPAAVLTSVALLPEWLAQQEQ